ncbi:MAG: type II toxin-antitoxin system PemK/MazF family toxin [Pseudomonadota bacterium]
MHRSNDVWLDYRGFKYFRWMPIRFHPKYGTLVLVDFNTGFIPPEMGKRRPAIVISRPMKGRPGLCTIVPLSTQAPAPQMNFHMPLVLPEEWPSDLLRYDSWVKADMITAVSFGRIDLLRAGRSADGRRIYFDKPLPQQTMRDVTKCVLHGLSLSTLTEFV